MDLIYVVFTSLLSVVALFLIAKIMGHKQIAQLDFFDYISGITIGSIAAELATDLENPLRPLISIIIYGSVSVGLNALMSKFPKTRKYINGTPTIILNNGKLYRKNMKKAKLDLSEFMALCRQEGYFHIKDIQTAIFEYSGRLTILPVSTQRPLNPSDMKLNPPQDELDTELIMDGRIMGENLTRMGVNETWLHRQLSKKGHSNPKKIYLAVCDKNHQVTVYPKE